MQPIRVCHFEDAAVGDLEPLALTRPAFELLCGHTSLGRKQGHFFRASETGCLVRPHLSEWGAFNPAYGHANHADWLRAAPVILVNSRWLPPEGAAEAGAASFVAVVEDEVAYAVVQPEQVADCTFESSHELLEHWKRKLPVRNAGGWMVRYPWELVARNGEQLGRDFIQRREDGLVGWRPASLALVGSAEQCLVHPTAHIDPMVVADTRNGPVLIDRGAAIGPFSRLEGPCYIGPFSQIHGANVRGGTTIGPHCRVGGEIEASILHGYTNKYHDGFLGHAYVGEWVNLAAGTQNSDLRNDYGHVTVTLAGRAVNTGMSKIGCFIGDHTKTGLGTLLNTGSNIGAFCNLLPSGGLLPRYFPSFTSWWNASVRENDDLESLQGTARQVMQRRGCTLTAAHEALYQHLLETTAAQRDRFLRDAEKRRLRQAA